MKSSEKLATLWGGFFIAYFFFIYFVSSVRSLLSSPPSLIEGIWREASEP